MTSVFIVEDHPVMREGYESLIGLEPDLEIVGAAASAEDALPALERLMPAVAVVDLQLPGVNGVELIKRIRALDLDIRLLVVSAHEEDLYAERALRAGAQGYLMKSASAQFVVEAVRTVAAGRLYISATLRGRLLGDWLERGEPSSSIQVLTDREIEVFELIGRAMTTQEMADTLSVSRKTIESHRANIKAKLGISSLPELIQRAVLWVESPLLGSG